MSFKFQQKKEPLNWEAVRQTDIQQLMASNDVDRLENVVGNLARAQLSREDLRLFGDKNLIKLFKVGQLTLEYLTYQHQHADVLLNSELDAYQAKQAEAKPLEEETKRGRQQLLNLRAEAKLKRRTLAAYEQMLQTPLGKAHIFKCVIC